jgi:hypothetical protein
MKNAISDWLTIELDELRQFGTASPTISIHCLTEAIKEIDRLHKLVEEKE